MTPPLAPPFGGFQGTSYWKDPELDGIYRDHISCPAWKSLYTPECWGEEYLWFPHESVASTTLDGWMDGRMEYWSTYAHQVWICTLYTRPKLNVKKKKPHHQSVEGYLCSSPLFLFCIWKTVFFVSLPAVFINNPAEWVKEAAVVITLPHLKGLLFWLLFHDLVSSLLCGHWDVIEHLQQQLPVTQADNEHVFVFI